MSGPSLCMVVHGPYPVGEPRVTREAAAAREAGWDVTVLALGRTGEVSEEIVDGVRVVRAPLHHSRGSGLKAMAREYGSFVVWSRWALWRMSRGTQFDVVQVHNPPDFLLAAALGARRRGASIVLDIHDLAPDMFRARFGERRGVDVGDAILRYLELWATSQADAVITVHEPYRRELVARGVNANKIEVVMNSLDANILPRSDTLRARRPDRFRVVYHGTLTPWYGVDVLVDAIAMASDDIPDLTLDVYGEGDAVPDLLSQVARLKLESVVTIHQGYLPHREVLRAVQGAAAGVIPNLPIGLNRYALSSKLFEYVEMGIPVVSAELYTIRRHFDDFELTFFRPGDASDLARALKNVALEPEATEQKVIRARSRYLKYDWPSNAARYRGVLAQLRGGKN